MLAATARNLYRRKPVAATLTGSTAASLITTAVLFVRATRVGKFEVWAEILKGLRLRGDETLLDLGCGRGAVLLAAAKLLPNARAVGVDVWRADQTDNSADNTLHNAVLEGVADRVEVRTADITDLPLRRRDGRRRRQQLGGSQHPNAGGSGEGDQRRGSVLRPGGRLVLADIWATRRHMRQLRQLGWTDVARRNLGWRMWWGPRMGTHLITATKPAQAAVGGTAGTD